LSIAIALVGCGRIGFDPLGATPFDGMLGERLSETSDALVCPADMARTSGSTSGAFCIDLAEVGIDKWAAASSTCMASGKKMCSKIRLEEACGAAPVGVIDLTDDWEWSADYGSLLSVYAVNNGSCGVETFFNDTNMKAYRCCAP
jgi:hypothetical protein